MEHQDPPAVAGQQQQKRPEDDIHGESSSEATSSVKRQLIDGDRGMREMESSSSLLAEIQKYAATHQARLTQEDRTTIEAQLHSNSSILVLEGSYTSRSHCRAQFCLPGEISGWPNIESRYRINLLDITGRRVGARSYFRQLNQFYHVTCMEQILDLQPLLSTGQLKMQGGISRTGWYGSSFGIERFTEAIEDWFEYNGRSFDDDEYDGYKKALEDWAAADGGLLAEPKTEAPKKNDCFAEQRTPRLLSQVLASVAKVQHIDHLPRDVLEALASSSDVDREQGNNSSAPQNQSSDPHVAKEESSLPEAVENIASNPVDIAEKNEFSDPGTQENDSSPSSAETIASVGLLAWACKGMSQTLRSRYCKQV